MRIEYSKEFMRGYMEAIIALFTGFIDLFAGYFAVHILDFSITFKWALLVLPPLLSGRGAIAGVSTGNMTTMLHLGSMKPSIKGNTDEFYTLVSAVIVTSFFVAIYTTILIFLSMILMGINYFLEIFSVVILTFVASIFISIFLTASLASLTFRISLDPDIVTYPVISSVNDVIISAMYLAFLFLLTNSLLRTLLIVATGFIIIVIIYLILQNIDDSNFNKTVKEALSAGIIAVTIASISGHYLKSVERVLDNHREILIVLPTILTCLGDQGSMYSSRTTTKLYQSSIEPEILEYFDPQNLYNVFTILTAGLTMFAVYGYIGIIYSGNSNMLVPFLLVLFIIGLIGSFLVTFMGFTIAVVSFRYNLNPDNFVIPFVTTLTDLLFTVILVVMTDLIYAFL